MDGVRTFVFELGVYCFEFALMSTAGAVSAEAGLLVMMLEVDLAEGVGNFITYLWIFYEFGFV